MPEYVFGPKSYNFFKVPLKIKLFHWLTCCGVILTKGNLAKQDCKEIHVVAIIFRMRLYNLYFLLSND